LNQIVVLPFGRGYVSPLPATRTKPHPVGTPDTVTVTLHEASPPQVTSATFGKLNVPLLLNSGAAPFHESVWFPPTTQISVRAGGKPPSLNVNMCVENAYVTATPAVSVTKRIVVALDNLGLSNAAYAN